MGLMLGRQKSRVPIKVLINCHLPGPFYVVTHSVCLLCADGELGSSDTVMISGLEPELIFILVPGVKDTSHVPQEDGTCLFKGG